MVTALLNARVLIGDGLVEGLAVIIEGMTIREVAKASMVDICGMAQVDLDRKVLAPGFIDLQVNGGGDVLFNDDPSEAALEKMVAAHRQFGTTGMLPTVISSTRDVLYRAIDVVAESIARGMPGILGLHVEGPFIAGGRRGVHNPSTFRSIDDEDVRQLARLRGGVALLTVAPECIDLSRIAELRRAGVVVALGHTDATYETARAALVAGASGFTHLFNAMSPLQSRSPGVVGAALEDASSWCGIINDGHHVHPAALRLAIKAKPKGKMLLVTDAMPPVGGCSSTFELDGRHIQCADGRCTTTDGVLAGSALDMATAVRNSVAQLDMDPAEALRMAAEFPARAIGLDGKRGHIVPGHLADLVALDANYRACIVWQHGIQHGI